MNHELLFTTVRPVKNPVRAHSTDAGIDFYVPFDFTTTILHSGADVLIPSGVKAIIPEGMALIAMNKSGVSTKKKLRVGACVCDTGYTGEIHIHLFNDGLEPIAINPGEKIVQFVLVPVVMGNTTFISNDEYERLTNNNNESSRGSTGFGASGAY